MNWRQAMSVAALLPWWQVAREPAGKSPKTIKSYSAAVRSLATFLRDHDMPDGVEDVTSEHFRAFVSQGGAQPTS
jgi:hypothetical protein